VKDILEKEGIKPLDIQLRAKSYWSLYQKLLRKEMNFEKIYDLIALRIIVDSVEDCYKTLGILHKRWRPLPGEIKDFIALPKPNGYQSLHTVCFCLEGRITEFQIRTLQMHETAENGICAHWAYKEKIVQKDYRRHFRWVSQLREWQKEIQNSKDFFDGLKFDFFRNRIFVFTPKGEVIDLPERATPIDFAFAVHTEIGNQAVGAKINGKIASLSQPLKNGDKVEILRDKNKRPSRDWLEFVKTGLARSQIKKWLKERERPENLKRGLSILNRDFRQFQGISFSKISQEKKDELLKVFPYKNLENLIVAIGEGELSSKEIIKVVFKEILTASETQPQLHFPKGWKEKKASVYLGGANGILINLAKCCSPQPGDKVKAYITKTRGATLHKVGCENLKRIQSKWPQRIIEASWTQPKIKTYEVSLRIKARDRIGLFRDITSAISAVKINMIRAEAEAMSPGKSAVFDVKVEVAGWEDLDKLFGQLKEVKGVKEIKRI
jgi:GTP pyrophosphokinase